MPYIWKSDDLKMEHVQPRDSWSHCQQRWEQTEVNGASIRTYKMGQNMYQLKNSIISKFHLENLMADLVYKLNE